jgi:transposase
MTDQETIVGLQAELAAAYETITALTDQITALIAQNGVLVARVAELEKQRATTSRNSSKPPSSDGPARRPKSLRGRSGKKRGGQPEHAGAHLRLGEAPDHVVVAHPAICGTCQGSLAAGALVGRERRQVIEVPSVRPTVTEYQGQVVRCPVCQATTRGAFPPEVTAPVQYGPRLRAVAVYLTQQQLLPYGRTREVLTDLLGCPVAEGTLAALTQEAAERVEPVEEAIAAALRAGPLLHNDETGLSVQGKRWWLHSASTARLTHYGVHPQRGAAATDALGILPGFAGTSVHDGWAPYRQYACRHALCNAHHLRELVWVEEQDGQAWAGDMATLLRTIKKNVETARAAGKTALPKRTRTRFHRRYARLIADGRAANPPPPQGGPARRGRPKQSKAQNLLDRLARTDEVLAFMDDLTIPFDNNQAERDVRMVKVQQKVSGTFRSESGAHAFARLRGYLSTLRKQGIPLLAALESVFAGQPLLPDLQA